MGFPRQEYWSELPFPPLGDLPHPRTEPVAPALAGRILYHWATIWNLSTYYLHISGYCTFTNVGKPLPIYTMYTHMACTAPKYMPEESLRWCTWPRTRTAVQADESGYNHPSHCPTYPGAACTCVMFHQKYQAIWEHIRDIQKKKTILRP